MSIFYYRKNLTRIFGKFTIYNIQLKNLRKMTSINLQGRNYGVVSFYSFLFSLVS